MRADRLASRRHLVYHRQIEIAVDRECERPRDRRRGHHQDVRVVALLLERRSLKHPETVLLVHYDKTEPREVHAFLDQRVSADHYLRLARCYPLA